MPLFHNLKLLERPMYKIILADILTKNVNCIKPEENLARAFQALSTNNHSCCVIASENNVPLGILTERDLVRIISVHLDGKAGTISEIMSQPISLYMTTSPFTLPQNTALESALDWIDKKNIRHLLVTSEDGILLGIVTQTDMVKAYTRIIRNHSTELEATVEQRTKQLETLNRKLITLSLVDPLTGLGNRRAMEVEIMRVHAAGIRQNRAYTIVLFDIDYFKKYNDHYGHQAGDKVLSLVANHFREGIRESDSIYRYGGEEFLLIMPDTNADEAFTPVQRIIKTLSDTHIEHVDSPLKHLTTSAGIACSHNQGQRLANWRQVVEIADEGLYEAKHSGRNQALIREGSQLQAVK